MGQYLQFRSWARTSSGSEKALAATAATVVLALTAWSLSPTSGSSDQLAVDTQAPGTVAGQDAGTAPVAGGAASGGSSGAVEAVAPGTGGGQATAGPAAGSAGRSSGGQAAPAGGGTAPVQQGGQPAAGGSKCPQGSDVGVTAKELRIAAVLLNLGGAIGNGAVGLASVEQQRKMSEAAVADLNARNAAACRTIKVTYYESNPIDPSTARNVCLQIVQSRFYAVVDLGGFSYPPGVVDCIPQNKIPVLAALGPLPSQQKDYGPYYMSLAGDPVAASRTSILAMHKRGFFDRGKGFKKLGMYVDDCVPEVNTGVLAALGQVGIKKSDISMYEFTCPSGGFASPDKASAAVVQHQRDGVSHVIPITGGGSFKPYSTAAQNQRYKPKYTVLDLHGINITATTDTGPDRDNFDGTVMASTLKLGMPSSGFSDKPTDECKALFKRRGVDPSWVTSAYQGGMFCNQWQVFARAAGKAPSMTRTALAQGLGALGRVPLSYASQDAVFAPNKYSGGDFWWPIQYSKSCNCWKVLDKTPRPSFR